MATPLPVAFRASPLPSNFKGTPQDLLDAFVARLSMETEEDLALYVAGSVEPTSDSGPWLKNNLTWWVWDVDSGAYIPQPLEQASLRYIIQQDAPSSDDYDVWIQTNSLGKATAIKTYYAAAWHDIYEDKFTAIDAELAAAAKSYPVSVKMGGSQLIVADASYNVMELDTEIFDPDNAYNSTTFRYVAPVSGYYFVTAEFQVDNYSADATQMEFALIAFKNGSPTDVSSGNSAVSPPGQRWYPAVTGLLQLAANDYVEIVLTANDGGTAGSVSASNATANFYKVQSV